MNAHLIHVEAEAARENDELIKALTLIEEALVAYQKEKDYEGFSQALQSRVLTYKHLFLLTKDHVFAILAKNDANASLEITQKHNITTRIGSCYFRLGEVAMLFEDYKSAVENYQKALDNYAGSNSERGDYRYHLGFALGKIGQLEKAKETMLNGLSEIQENRNEVNSFLTHVWESGGYMRLAELLRQNEPEQAKKYLEEARKIIKSDKKLIIRKRQIEELEATFTS